MWEYMAMFDLCVVDSESPKLAPMGLSSLPGWVRLSIPPHPYFHNYCYVWWVVPSAVCRR